MLWLTLALVATGCRFGYQERPGGSADADVSRPDVLLDGGPDSDAGSDADSPPEASPDGDTPTETDADTDGAADGSPDTGPVCGDGVVEAPETCDDANTVAGDGCEADCQPSFTEMDNVVLLAEPPLDLDSQRHDHYLLIPEQLDHALSRDLPVEAFTPGPIDTGSPESGVVRAGARVHVYLLHLRTATTDHLVHARVAFDNPIIALIITREGLLATDWLGVPGLLFDDTWRGLDSEDSGTLEASAVELDVLNQSYSDQLRVIVATRPDHGIVVE